MTFVRLLTLTTACLFGTANADDWPAWSGAAGVDQWTEDGVLTEFPKDGLKPTWSVKIGSGYSGPVVSDGCVYVTDYLPKPETKKMEAIERLVCLDEQTGKTKWVAEWETHYRRQMASYATGPRATPLVTNGRVFVLGSTGRILAIDAKTGDVQWKHDALEDFGGQVPIWAYSASPVAFEDTVIFACGGSEGMLLCFDQATGTLKWRGLPIEHEASYSSPAIMTLAGRTQLVQWSMQQLGGFDPATGKQLWAVPFTCQSNMGIGRPVQIGNRLLVSCFYNGSMLIEVGKDGAEVIWKKSGTGERKDKTDGLHAVITTPIVEGDYFYGTGSYGELRGLKLADSERLWEDTTLTRQDRWGSMFWVKNQDHYFVNNDLGELLIMKFRPEGPQVIDRAQLIEPTTHCGFGSRRFADALVNWVHPAYANRHIIIRNDAEIRRVSLEQK